MSFRPKVRIFKIVEGIKFQTAEGTGEQEKREHAGQG